jgi:MFS family permease
MTSPLAATSPESSLRYPGWRVVLASHLGVMVSFGCLVVFTFGVFLKPLALQFGWTREGISGAFSTGAVVVGLASPVLGQLLDRRGARAVVIPCMVIFIAAFASLGFLTPRLWQLYAAFIVLGLVGNGTASLGYSGAVASWFTERRGTALALSMAGLGTGSILLPVVAQRVIDAVGWRAAYFALAALGAVLGLPATLRWLHHRRASTAHLHAHGDTVGNALDSRVFWILAFTLLLSSVSVIGTVTHLPAMLSDRGLAAPQAAAVVASLGAASLAGRLGTGWLLDRFFGPYVAMVLLASIAAGIFIMSSAATVPLAITGAVLIGIGMGGEFDVTPYLLARYFGLRSFGTLFGLTWTFYAIAGGVGPVLMGRAYDATGSYSHVMLLLLVPVVLSGVLFALMPRYPDRAFG